MQTHRALMLLDASEMYLNGLNFLTMAGHYFKEMFIPTKSKSEKIILLKYVVLNIFSGTCLFLKLKLYMEHDWKEILVDKDQNKSEAEIRKGNFKTINFNQILNRRLFKNKKIISLEMRHKLKKLNQARNILEHFRFLIHRNEPHETLPEYLEEHIKEYTKLAMDCYGFTINFVEDYILPRLLRFDENNQVKKLVQEIINTLSDSKKLYATTLEKYEQALS